MDDRTTNDDLASAVADDLLATNPEAWLAAIVDSSDDAIIGKTLDSVIRSWNAGATRVFGWTLEEAIGQPVYILIPPERHYEEPDIIGRLVRGDRVDHYETVRLHKDGTRLDVSLSISPIRDKTGRIIGAAKIARHLGSETASESRARARRSAPRARHRARAAGRRRAVAAGGARADERRADANARRSGRGAPSRRGGERGEEPVPGDDEPRAAHAAQRDRRLCESAHDGHSRSAHRRAGTGPRPDQAERRDAAPPGRRRVELRQARVRQTPLSLRRGAVERRPRHPRAVRGAAPRREASRLRVRALRPRRRSDDRPRQGRADHAQSSLERGEVHGTRPHPRPVPWRRRDRSHRGA